MIIKKEFLKTVIKSFDPDSYKGLSKRKFSEAINYLLSLIFISLLIMSFLALPSVTRIPTYLQNEFQKVNKASIEYDIDMIEPIIITKENPKVIIDTTGQTINITNEVLLITNKGIFYNLNNPKIINKEQLMNFKELDKEVGNITTFLILLIMPSILLITYFIYLIKYLILIFLFSTLAHIINKVVKLNIKYRKVLKIAMYSATIMVLTDIISIPFFTNNYFIPIILYAITYSIAILMVGEKE